jgi:hypothetical protein
LRKSSTIGVIGQHIPIVGSGNLLNFMLFFRFINDFIETLKKIKRFIEIHLPKLRQMNKLMRGDYEKFKTT